jgi:multiple sugar transport system substrate-binding protein
MTMWVRASGANAAQRLIDLWNSGHPDKITLTVIPDNQMVSKLATGVGAGDVPDLISFDLIYMPDFMRAGFLTDITDSMKGDPNFGRVAKAFTELATYNGRLYGTGFTPDVSILIYNKDLFKKAGLDPNQPPKSLAQIHDYAKKIRALGPDIYGFYFSGSCPGCNIFTTSPMMVASGAKILPAKKGDEPLAGTGVKEVLQLFPRHVVGGADPEERPVGQRLELRRELQDRQDRDPGSRGLPDRRPEEGRAEPGLRSRLPPGRQGRARPRRSSAATSSRSPRAASTPHWRCSS